MLGRAVVGAIFAFLACACSDDAQNIDGPASLFCRGYCRGAPRCGGDLGSCESSCKADSGLSNLSSEGARRYGECLGSLDCDQNGDEAAIQACWDDVRVDVPPTPELRSFCSRYAEAWFECGYFSSVADCEDIFGMWAEGLLDQVAACTEQTCLALEACVDAVFERP